MIQIIFQVWLCVGAALSVWLVPTMATMVRQYPEAQAAAERMEKRGRNPDVWIFWIAVLVVVLAWPAVLMNKE